MQYTLFGTASPLTPSELNSDRPDHVCQPERLASAFRQLGGTARLPSLWIFARNDHFFSPAIAAQLRDAYVSGGAPVELSIVAPFGDDGHRLFAAPSVWWAYVAPFLRRLDLPTEIVNPAIPTTLRPPPSLGRAGRSAFEAYASSEGFEKAFAVGGNHCGWADGMRTRAAAAEVALARCAIHGRSCVLYAVGTEYSR